MKKVSLLGIAILGNGLGSAIMFQTHLGMSAWGAAASNVSKFAGITPGFAFIIVSLVFYGIALFLRKKMILLEVFLSLLFLASFSSVLDLFIWLIPDMTTWHVMLRVGLNIIGILILLFSISLHLHIGIAVHPMDVFLQTMQEKFHSVAIGTYVAYGSAFMVAIGFGVLSGGIRDLGFGTVIIVLLGGSIMKIYDTIIFSSQESV